MLERPDRLLPHAAHCIQRSFPATPSSPQAASETQQFGNFEGGTQWGPLMAAVTFISLPPFLTYQLVQRPILDTADSSGVKG